MAVITVGNSVINRTGNCSAGATIAVRTGLANGEGTINSVSMWGDGNLTGVEVALFFIVSGTNLTTRSNYSIGNVTGGSVQTFSGLNMEVALDDMIGFRTATGWMEGTYSANQIYKASGDCIPCTNQYFLSGEKIPSISGLGSTAVEGNVIFFGCDW